MSEPRRDADSNSGGSAALVLTEQRHVPVGNGANAESRTNGAAAHGTILGELVLLKQWRSVVEKQHWEDYGLLGKGAYGLVKKVGNVLDGQVYARKEIYILLHKDARLTSRIDKAHKALREIRALTENQGSQHVVAYHHAYLEASDATLNTLLAQMLLSICLRGAGACDRQPERLAHPAAPALPSPDPNCRPPVAIHPLPPRPASPSLRSRPAHRPARNATPPPSAARSSASLRRTTSMPSRRRAFNAPRGPTLIEVPADTPSIPGAASLPSVEHPLTPPSTVHPFAATTSSPQQHPTPPQPLFAHVNHHPPPHLAIITNHPASPLNLHHPLGHPEPPGGPPSSPSASDPPTADSPTLGLLSTPSTPLSSSTPTPPESTLQCTLLLAALMLFASPAKDSITTDVSHPGVQGLTSDSYGDTTCAERIQEKQRQGYELVKVCILMELINGPNLQQWLQARNAQAKDDICIGTREVSIVRQLIGGVFDIHRNNYLHRDIKPANIYLHLKPPPDPNRRRSSDLPAPPAPSPESPPAPSPAAEPSTSSAGPEPSPVRPVAAAAAPTAASGTAPFSVDAEYVVKIGDFGLAVPVDDGECAMRFEEGADAELGRAGYGVPSVASEYQQRERSGGVGTLSYQAPEMQRRPRGSGPGGREGKAAMYGRSVDMYALGLTILEVFVPLRTEHERMAVFRAAKQELKLPRALCERRPDVADLIRSLLDPDPMKRPVAKVVYNHPCLSTTPQSTVVPAPRPSIPATAAAPATTAPAAYPHYPPPTSATQSVPHTATQTYPTPATTIPQPFATPPARLGASAPECLLSPSPPSTLPPGGPALKRPSAAATGPLGAAPANPPRNPHLRAHHARSNSLPHAMPPGRQQQLLTPPAPALHPQHSLANDLSDQASLVTALSPPRDAPAPPAPPPTRSPPGTTSRGEMPTPNNELLYSTLVEQQRQLTYQLSMRDAAAKRKFQDLEKQLAVRDARLQALEREVREYARRASAVPKLEQQLKVAQHELAERSRAEQQLQRKLSEQAREIAQLQDRLAQAEGRRANPKGGSPPFGQLHVGLEAVRHLRGYPQQPQQGAAPGPDEAAQDTGGVGYEPQQLDMLGSSPELQAAAFVGMASVPPMRGAAPPTMAMAPPGCGGAGYTPAAAANSLVLHQRRQGGGGGGIGGVQRGALNSWGTGDGGAGGVAGGGAGGAGASPLQQQLAVGARSMSASAAEDTLDCRAGGQRELLVGPRSASASAAGDGGGDARAGHHHYYHQQHLPAQARTALAAVAAVAAGEEDPREPLRGSRRKTPADLSTLLCSVPAAVE